MTGHNFVILRVQIALALRFITVTSRVGFFRLRSRKFLTQLGLVSSLGVGVLFNDVSDICDLALARLFSQFCE